MAKKKRDPTPDVTEAGTAVFVARWGDSPEGMPTLFANQMLVSHAGGQFYLVFGEVLLPLEPDLAKAMKENRLPRELPIRVVARLAIPPESMFQIQKAIQENVSRYLAQKNANEAGHAPNAR